MSSKMRLIVGLVALAVFGTLGLVNFKNSMTPYVSFAEAMTMERTVQVAGFPDHKGSGFNSDEGAFEFTMKNDDDVLMKVRYRGGKPGNFDQAESVVVIGDYDGGIMEAKQILVKCPSKYEALGDEHPGESAEDKMKDLESLGSDTPATDTKATDAKAGS